MKKLLKFFIFFFLIVAVSAAQAQVDFFFHDAAKPGRFSSAVDLSDSLPKVKAMVNGKEEVFVLDNACSYLLINGKFWTQKMEADSNIIAKGVGGKVQAGTVFIDSFNWSGIGESNS